MVLKLQTEYNNLFKLNNINSNTIKTFNIKRREIIQTSISTLFILPFLTPYPSKASIIEDGKKIEYGPINNGIRSCPSNLNPNCISTSSINANNYGSPWKSKIGTVTQVTDVIVTNLPFICKGSILIEQRFLDDGNYLKFSVAGLYSKDYIEFLIKNLNKSVNQETYIFYRSIAGSVKFIYPFQQPLSDFEAQKKRMMKIRKYLKFELVGCDLLECYSDFS